MYVVWRLLARTIEAKVAFISISKSFCSSGVLIVTPWKPLTLTSPPPPGGGGGWPYGWATAAAITGCAWTTTAIYSIAKTQAEEEESEWEGRVTCQRSLVLGLRGWGREAAVNGADATLRAADLDQRVSGRHQFTTKFG